MSDQLNYEINKELGECYLFMGELDKAEDYYNKAAASMEEQADPYMGLGAIAMQRGNMDEALSHYSKAVSIRESDKALAGLGLVHMQQGEHQKAFELFSCALKLNPTNKVALSCLVREGYEQQRVAELLPFLQAGMEASEGLEAEKIRVSLAGCLISLDRKAEAHTHLSAVLETNPGNTDARQLLDHISA